MLPNQAPNPVLEAIGNAQQSIDVEMYILTDQAVVQALLAAAQPPRNVRVRVLLNGRFSADTLHGNTDNPNQRARKTFRKTAVKARWTSRQFTYTHQKSMVIDGRDAWIMTANMSNAAYTRNREYLIDDAGSEDVAEIEQIFECDWHKRAWKPGPAAAHLLVSPYNSRTHLLGLIGQAQKTIAIEDEEMGDPQVVQALIARAHARPPVQVRVLLADPAGVAGAPGRKTSRVAGVLAAGGCQVQYLTTPYLHAKTVIVDGLTAYTGSVNLTANSLDHNRELGILISQPDVVQELGRVVSDDWAHGKPAAGARPG